MNSEIQNPNSAIIRVFLADDHTVVRDGLRMLLESQSNMRVTGDTGDGRQAVQLAIKLCPDIVIMDIAMPGINGIEATVRITRNCPATKVIILSMYATTEHIAHAIKAGARGYLLKESAGAELISAVRTVYTGGRYLSRQILSMGEFDYFREKNPRIFKSPLELLSSREREVLHLVVEGKSSLEIARILTLSPKTIETYRSRLMKKLGVENITALVKFAIHHGITPVK